MITRLIILSLILAQSAESKLEAQFREKGIDARRLDFNKLPDDDKLCDWLRAVSPSFKDAYDATVKRPYVKGIRFSTVPHKKTAFGELGVFFSGGVFEIRLSAQLTGAERVRTLAFELANAYLNEEHRQIDVGAANGFFSAREFAVAHEIYEYEAWRMYRRFLLELEKVWGHENLPADLFYGTPANRVADYQLPPLSQYLKHMEDSQHMKHYLDWFQKYYSKSSAKNANAEPSDARETSASSGPKPESAPRSP